MWAEASFRLSRRIPTIRPLVGRFVLGCEALPIQTAAPATSGPFTNPDLGCVQAYPLFYNSQAPPPVLKLRRTIACRRGLKSYRPPPFSRVAYRFMSRELFLISAGRRRSHREGIRPQGRKDRPYSLYIQIQLLLLR